MYLEIEGAERYRAALYIRLSREDETDGPSESVSNQRAMLEDFARQRGVPVAGLYVDDGWSGTSFDRPEFRRMLRDIEAGRVNMVITKDLSRLGRDYIMTGHYMERYFPEHRVRYISLLDGIDTGVDSSANEITPFRAIMNDMYAKDISKKISSVKRDKQRKGLFVGGKPVYGYQMHPAEKNKIVVDEGAAPVVRRIFRLALEGLSCRQIAAQLNAEGIPSPGCYAGLYPSGTGQWSGERISEMLQNETYIGNMVQGRRRKVSYKSKKCIRQLPEDWVVVEGTHEPLVTPETFERVGRLLASRRHTRSRTYEFPLKGLLFCHECGHPLAVLNRKNSRGEDVRYLVCRTYQRFTKTGGCTCHCIQEQTVTRAVVAKLREACGACLEPAALLPAARSAVAEAHGGENPTAEIRALRAKIGRLTTVLDRMYLDQLSGLLAEADFARLYRQAREERGALERRVTELERRESPGAGDKAGALVQRFLDEAGDNRELLVSLIERVELTEQRELIIHFRFCPPEALF